MLAKSSDSDVYPEGLPYQSNTAKTAITLLIRHRSFLAHLPPSNSGTHHIFLDNDNIKGNSKIEILIILLFSAS